MKKQVVYKNNLSSVNVRKLPNDIIVPSIKNVKVLSSSTKEWPNSVYNFNKTNIEYSQHKTQIINKIIKSYFNLVLVTKNSKNSKRMRDLIRRSSTKKLFVSKSEIKQYPDKIMYTMYVFNKEKNLYAKKIFLLNKSLSKFSNYKLNKIRHLNSLQAKLQLNKIRPLNRLGTINYSIGSELEQLKKSYLFQSKKKESKRFILHKSTKKSFLYKSIKKLSLRKSAKKLLLHKLTKKPFLHKSSKSLIYYINSYNIIKQKPLLKLKTKGLKKDKKFPSYLKKIYRYKNEKRFVFGRNNIKNNRKDVTLNSFNYKSNNEVWKGFFRNKTNTFFQDKLSNLLSLSIKKKQSNIFKSIFFFNFAVWVLSRFNLHIIVDGDKIILNNNNDKYHVVTDQKTNRFDSYNSSVYYYLSSYINNKLVKKVKLIKSKIKKINKGLSISINNRKTNTSNKTILKKVNMKLTKLTQTKLTKLNKKLRILQKAKLILLRKIRLNKLSKLNSILFNLLFLVLKKGELYNLFTQTNQNSNLNRNINAQSYIDFLFKQFKDEYLWDALRNTFIKQLLGIHYLYRHSINNFKYNRFLTGLKTILLKIFNKSPQINIVNLKYLHLNSDILIEAISTKLKNKKANLLRTIKKALKLVKLPKIVRAHKNEITTNQSELKNTYDNYSNKLQDIINVSLTNMFFKNHNRFVNSDPIDKERSNKLTNPNNIHDTAKDIYISKHSKLNDLKHKWITGVKIEGKGRLTKRYRADRSVFKFKHKGSLKDLNFKDIYYRNFFSLKKNQPMTMLKGQTTPNIQYSFAKWKRHVGSYGIKGWISNN